MVLKDLKDGTVNIRKKQDGFFPQRRKRLKKY